MEIEVLKSKIHMARGTATNFNYIGSITIDKNGMQLTNLFD